MSFPRKVFLEGHTYHEIDWTQLQDNIGNYYDPLIQNHIASTTPHPNITLDNIPDGTTYKRITATEKGYYDLMYSAFGGSPSMDNIPQGTNYIKFTAAEYALFLTSYHYVLDQVTTVKFGHNRNVAAFYFANGADADGANIYGNDLFSRGKPVYVLVFASPWILITPGNDTGDLAHGLGYRPSFGILQTCLADPTGTPEDYIVTGDYGATGAYFYKQNFAAWNNQYYVIGSASGTDRYFRVLLFSYMGA